MTLIVTVLVVFAILCVNELVWRRQKMHSELSRKFVHIAVGSFVATWPFYLSWNEIRLLSIGFLVVVGISRYFKIFQAIHSVQRPTWGEVYFALAVGLITFATHSKGIYAAALLQMSLADGLAAIVGVTYGKDNEYRVFGQTKSVVGSSVFLVVSYLLLAGYAFITGTIVIEWCLGIALLATVLENIAIRGLDNLLVPLLVAAVLGLVG